MHEWRGLGRGYFPIALFVDARPEIPLLGPLLDNKRRAALRARLRNRFVRGREIAIGIAAAPIKNPPAPRPLEVPRRTNSPSLHFGHLIPSVIGRVYLHFG